MDNATGTRSDSGGEGGAGAAVGCVSATADEDPGLLRRKARTNITIVNIAITAPIAASANADSERPERTFACNTFELGSKGFELIGC